MSDITYEHVTKRFGETTAIKDFNLKIKDKEFLVLVGPSGCGKSTAMRLLAGLEEITEGNIYIGDRRVNDVPAKDRDTAMVFQSYALYPHMSVFDNMAFGLSLRKVPKPEIADRVKEAARTLDISDLLDRKPRQLSGGQRQRVALGRAIVRKPTAFLLDEPLSNLDAKLRVQTRAQLSKLHQRLGITFIYVTHDQVEAMTMADRIAVMNKGVLQQVGTPQYLYENPINLFVAGFIGSPAMNFFPAKVVGDREISFDIDGFQVRVPPEKAAALEPVRGKNITFGIRPEHIHNKDFLPAGCSPEEIGVKPSPVKSRVEVTELLGNELFLHLVNGEQSYLARVDTRTAARPGQDIELIFDMAQMHAFDPDSGLNLLMARENQPVKA